MTDPDAVDEHHADPEALRAPGRHEVRAARPLETADALAARLGGSVVLPEDASRVMLARAALLHEDTPAALRRVAGGLARAERIVVRTEARALMVFEEGVGGGAAVALHPQTLRDASDRVRAARAAVTRAEAELSAFAAERAAEEAATRQEEAVASIAVEPRPSDTVEPGADHGLRNRMFGLVAATLGVGFIAAGTTLVPLSVAMLPGMVALVYAIIALRRADLEPEVDDTSETSERLAAIDQLSERLYAGRLPASLSAIEAAHHRRRQLLELDRDTALERLRVAERGWEELAGPGADPAAVEELLLRRDPQRHRAAPWVRESAAVRSAEVLAERSRTAWVQAWEALGRSVPNVADAEPAVAAVEADAAAATVDAPPMVLVDPIGVDDAVAVVASRVPVVVVLPERAKTPGAEGNRASG